MAKSRTLNLNIQASYFKKVSRLVNIVYWKQETR